jgi:hypothetical protein
MPRSVNLFYKVRRLCITPVVPDALAWGDR